MFDTGDPVFQIELCDRNTICALSTRGSNKKVISVLSLPTKITGTSDCSKAKQNSTDLKIKSGVFTYSDSTMILGIYETDRLLTSQSETRGLNVYNMNYSDTEQLAYERTIDFPVLNPELALLEKDKVVMARNSTLPTFIGDIDKETVLTTINLNKDLSDCIKPLCIGHNVIGLTSKSSGTTWLYDYRKPESEIGCIAGHESSSTPCLSFSNYSFYRSSEPSKNIYFISKSGLFKFYDLRNLSSPILKLQLPYSTANDRLKISFNPDIEDLISISGFDDNVYLFKVNNMSELFRHDGHSRTESCTKGSYVTDHFWYTDEYVISSALNNSINCWIPNMHCSI